MKSLLNTIDKKTALEGGLTLPASEQRLIYSHITIDCTTHTIEVDGAVVHLTASEFKILYLLACCPGEAFSAREIYCRVWLMEDLGNISPVRVHIANLRRKLSEVCPSHKFVICEWKKGYRFISS